MLLLEKTARTGTKVLASGGTRCNLTTTLGPDDAARLFGSRGERFLRPAFRALPPRAVRERFNGLGVPTVEAPLEKVFPASDRARDVRDALERWARGAGARIVLDAPVRAVEPAGERWVVRCDAGRAFAARALVLAAGGKSYPRSGTTGEGYAWLAGLDLEVVEPVPALVPLTSPAAWVRALAGISLQDVAVRLVDPERRSVLGRRERPVVFTHQGISGPGAMDLSEPLARRVAERGGRLEAPLELVLDPCAASASGAGSREALRELLIEAAGRRGAPRLANVLAEASGLPRRVLAAALAQAGLDAEARAGELARPQRHELVEALRGLRVPVDGTLGFERAEVTAGGLALGALDPRTMRVTGRPGLYVIGELVDLAGPIGGLNFQAAFATAELAARDVAARSA